MICDDLQQHHTDQSISRILTVKVSSLEPGLPGGPKCRKKFCKNLTLQWPSLSLPAPGPGSGYPG